MPRTQTSPTTSGGRSRASPFTQKHSPIREKTPPGVLEFASSDAPDSSPSPPHKPVKRTSGSTTKRKRKPKPKEEPTEVIEISSDDDDPPPPRKTAPPDLQIQGEKLKAVCAIFPISDKLPFECPVLIYSCTTHRRTNDFSRTVTH